MVDFEKRIINSDKFRFPLNDIEKYPKGISGIYKITNNINGKSYIGQSVDIINRLLRDGRL